MQWKRGLLIAGIHLAVVVAWTVQQESAVWPMIQANTDRAAVLRLAAWQEGPVTSFNPCDGGVVDAPMPTEERIVGFANLPVALLTGWHQPCATPGRLTAMVEGRTGRPTHGSEISVSIILCVLVFVQWMLVGGFPLVKPKQWWAEPAVFITACTVVSVALVIVPSFHDVAHFPMLIAVVAWVCWLVIILWLAIQVGLRKWMALPEAG
jgi:hypothetical protein